MMTVHGQDCVSDKSVRKWSAHFRAGLESLVDGLRPCQAHKVITADLIDKVEDLVRSDRRVALRMLAAKVVISVGTGCVIEKCARTGFRSNSLTSKRSSARASHLNVCFGTMKPPTFLEYQKTRCCLPSFSKSEVHFLLYFSSTEELLPHMGTLEHFKFYTGPSRTKDRSCLLRVSFCCTVKRVHDHTNETGQI